ncbi:S9 family peptidase [Herbaspirillum lusitanum]|uniref:S9 family peptidase n=1 Tax=Herbaspirillum lusitanum TaxID=213312 RepID=A0ABW9A339_9BURK
MRSTSRSIGHSRSSHLFQQLTVVLCCALSASAAHSAPAAPAADQSAAAQSDSAASAAAVSISAPPPVAAFASLPLISSPIVSPDGLSIAYFQNQNGESYLVTQLPGKIKKTPLSTDNKKFYFNGLRWVNNQRLLVDVRYPFFRYGNETIETRMLAVNSDGSNLKGDLLGSAFDFAQRKNVPQFQNRVLGKVEGEPSSVLIALDLDNMTKPDVYKLNVDNGQLRKLIPNPGSIYSWHTDRQGEVRAGSGWKDTQVRIIVKPPGADKWQTLSTYDAGNIEDTRKNAMELHGFDDDPRYLYVSADHEGRQALFKVDISDPAFPRQLIRADARFDLHGSLVYAKWLKKVVGFRYSGEFGERIYWDAAMQELQAQIDAALPRHTNTIVSSSDDGMRHIVYSSAPNEASRIFWLDRVNGALAQLANTRPQLDGFRMRPPQSVNFKSRDGVALHGYLTLPPASVKHAENTPYPLVLLPHGGPISRDVFSFDAMSQFLASRGWAVLQVNFRGSSGYGSEFETAGFKRWGMEMQDDLTDSVKWMVDSKLADPAKVCIVGANYGGYAAMMGVVKTPDLYRCAVSIAGVADLRDVLARAQHYVGYEIGAERIIGEWWKDRERLRQTSPVNRAKEIRTPLLLIHGKEDRIVLVDQSRDMVSALKDAGNTSYKYVELPLGDHNLSREEDRIRTFSEMEQFLKQYLD